MFCEAGWDTKADMSVEKVLEAFLAGPAEGHHAEALADLTLAAMQQNPDSHHSLDTVLETLLVPDIHPKAGNNLPNGHGHPAGSPESLEAQLDAIAVSEQHNSMPAAAEESRRQPDVTSAAQSIASETAGGAEPAGSAAPSQQLSRQGSGGKGSQNLSGGRLTHLCTLLSRVGAQSGQLQEGKQLWQPHALGPVAERLVQQDVLTSHPHAAKVRLCLVARVSQASHDRASCCRALQSVSPSRSAGGVDVLIWLCPGAGVAAKGRWRALIPER